MLWSDHIAPWTIIKAIKYAVEHTDYHEAILPLLLAHSNMAQLIRRNYHQQAPLSWAVEHHCAVAVKAFIEVGASLDEKIVREKRL